MNRVRVAGIYTQDEQILLVKHAKNNQEYFLLPGGRQESGEIGAQTLRREWKEELDLDIEVGKFLFCGESVPPINSKKPQVLQLVFAVNSILGEIKVTPQGALAGYRWVPIKELSEIIFFPSCMHQVMGYLNSSSWEVYSSYHWLK